IAVLTDRWADAGQYIFWSALVSFCHSFHSTFSDLPYRSSPSGVGKADGSVYWIHKKEWNTVRIKSNETDPRDIRDQSIHIIVVHRAHDPFPAICFRYLSDIDRMCLPGENHILRTDIDRFSNSPEIFHDSIFIVSSRKAQIHRTENPFAYST